MKRDYRQMMDQNQMPLNMESIAYHDFTASGHYYSPPLPPPQQILFSNPFHQQGDYVSEGYIPTSDAGFYAANRSLSEPFIHHPGDSFNSGSNSSASSSCSVSIAPTTPPPPPFSGPTKFPAIPITPSHHVPRQKAKRTATACEECRKRKQKCDGESPCQACKEQKLECKYREVTPTKKDNSIERLVALVEGCNKSIEALTQRLDDMGSMLRQIESRLSRCTHCGSKVNMDTGHCGSCTQIQCRL